MKQIFTIIFFALYSSAFSQYSSKIFTSDIDNFWVAYDSIQQTNEFSKKLYFINKLYIEKGTKGLNAFMKERDYNDSLYVKLIEEYPKFWNSIRPNTLTIQNKFTELNKAVENLKKLYPELKEAEMYFTIGGLSSGGTVTDNMVLVGAEVATGNSSVDMSEFKNDWLKNVFAKQSLDNIVYLNIHEYIHTQQNGDRNLVLNQSIKEGACDFIAELAIETPIETQYLSYGKNHESEIRELFKREMFSNNFSNWLYNGLQKGAGSDLGYYVGYEICKSYYENAKDKSLAIKKIIELNYEEDEAVEAFLYESKYFKETIDKKKLIEDYNKNLPYIVKIEPFENGSTNVNSNTKELKITFSKEMVNNSFSISYSEKGKEYFPVTKVNGFENNDKTIVLSIDLQANKDYEFVITNRNFKSKDGYPLKSEEYPIRFKTE